MKKQYEEKLTELNEKSKTAQTTQPALSRTQSVLDEAAEVEEALQKYGQFYLNYVLLSGICTGKSSAAVQKMNEHCALLMVPC